MQRLYVLYDARCGLCRLARLWASSQPAFIELIFIAAGSDEAKMRFPGLSTSDLPEELIVVSEEGEIYKDSSAWIMCLYALEDYREWSLRLASPLLRPLARQAFVLVSKNRKHISHWLQLSDREAAAVLNRIDAPSCAWTASPNAPTPVAS
jgi:predicted DCC family thiol-disulfide oxidoreductase YuxK